MRRSGRGSGARCRDSISATGGRNIARARESVALIDKNYRAYLRFTGPDRVRYLNAILTNNIKDLAAGHGIVSLFLNPQGQIQAEIETYARADSLFCISLRDDSRDADSGARQIHHHGRCDADR